MVKKWVSIPCRYAKNKISVDQLVAEIAFQSLVGTLKTVKLPHLSLTPSQFQSLVGTLKTHWQRCQSQRHWCRFNPL